MITVSEIMGTIREVQAENALLSLSPKKNGVVIMDNEVAAEFAVSIVRMAAKEYEKALVSLLSRPGKDRMRKLLGRKSEIERFFLSPDFEMYMQHTDGQAFMKQIQKNAAVKAKQKALDRVEKAESKKERKMQGG